MGELSPVPGKTGVAWLFPGWALARNPPLPQAWPRPGRCHPGTFYSRGRKGCPFPSRKLRPGSTRTGTPRESALGTWDTHCGIPPPLAWGGSPGEICSSPGSSTCPPNWPASGELSALAPGFPSDETRLPACLPKPLAAHTLSCGAATAPGALPSAPLCEWPMAAPNFPSREWPWALSLFRKESLCGPPGPRGERSCNQTDPPCSSGNSPSLPEGGAEDGKGQR